MNSLPTISRFFLCFLSSMIVSFSSIAQTSPTNFALPIGWEDGENMTSLSSPTLSVEASYPQLQINQAPRTMAKQVSLTVPSQGSLIHVMIIAPTSAGNDPYLQDIPNQIANSWQNDAAPSICTRDQQCQCEGGLVKN